LLPADQLGHFDSNKPAVEQLLNHGLQHQFEVNPSLTFNPQEHLNFAKYLKDQVLQIDAWDGTNMTELWGTCRVPLVRMLRQGQLSKQMSQEFELHDHQLNRVVGCLQLLMSNEGKGVRDEDMPTSHSPMKGTSFSPDGGRRGLRSDQLPASAPSHGKSKKKIYSKPLD